MLRSIAGFLLIVTSYSCVYHDTDPVVSSEPTFSCDSISWTKHIQPIMASSCAVTGCHDGITRLDWREYEEVKKFAQSVKSKTQDRSMPVGGSLSTQQIEVIACWVNKGAPHN